MVNVFLKKIIGKTNVLKKIFDLVFWIVIVGLIIVWIIDFINVKNDKDPMFCISKKIHKYDDGLVKECIGMGYKVYTYDRSSLSKGRQFGLFFIDMREN